MLASCISELAYWSCVSQTRHWTRY